jgi:hypothetical protein
VSVYLAGHLQPQFHCTNWPSSTFIFLFGAHASLLVDDAITWLASLCFPVVYFQYMSPLILSEQMPTVSLIASYMAISAMF